MYTDSDIIEKMVPDYKLAIESCLPEELEYNNFKYSQEAEYQIRLDLTKFIQSIGEEKMEEIDIEFGSRDSGLSFYEMFAVDFWLTRNHHGAGFWSGDFWGEFADFLTEKSHQMGEKETYLGDDQLVYFA